MRPVLEYGAFVWHTHGVVFQEELESTQKGAARFVTGNDNYETGSMFGILEQLKCKSPNQEKEEIKRLMLLY